MHGKVYYTMRNQAPCGRRARRQVEPPLVSSSRTSHVLPLNADAIIMGMRTASRHRSLARSRFFRRERGLVVCTAHGYSRNSRYGTPARPSSSLVLQTERWNSPSIEDFIRCCSLVVVMKRKSDGIRELGAAQTRG